MEFCLASLAQIALQKISCQNKGWKRIPLYLQLALYIPDLPEADFGLVVVRSFQTRYFWHLLLGPEIKAARVYKWYMQISYKNKNCFVWLFLRNSQRLYSIKASRTFDVASSSSFAFIFINWHTPMRWYLRNIHVSAYASTFAWDKQTA